MRASGPAAGRIGPRLHTATTSSWWRPAGLPVDRAEGPDGETEWRPSPGGLVTALEPVMRDAGGAWVGWPGTAGEAPEPFDTGGMHLVSVGLSEEEVRDYYEGFCNATLWPLYHDVIAQPEFHRPWWDAYVG